jgi:hypothetical protein
MPQLVYTLCALTSFACAILLWRAYRATRVPLLWWSTVCFSALALNNILLFLDRIVFPAAELMPFRSLVALIGFGALLYGLIFDAP